MSSGNKRNRTPMLFWGIALLFGLFVVAPELILALGLFIAILLGIFVAIRQSTGTGKMADWSETARRLFTTPLDGKTDQAIQAARQAAMAEGIERFVLHDVGMLVYEGKTEPNVYRLTDIPTTATHLRPFIVISPRIQDDMPNKLRFNLIDRSGVLRYTAKVKKVLKAGENFVTPPTWLPLAGREVNSAAWSLEVAVDGLELAVHEFGWLPVGGESRAQFTGDGEINELEFDPSDLAEDPLPLDVLLEQQGGIAAEEH